jgi:hypothetical protein
MHQLSSFNRLSTTISVVDNDRLRRKQISASGRVDLHLGDDSFHPHDRNSYSDRISLGGNRHHSRSTQNLIRSIIHPLRRSLSHRLLRNIHIRYQPLQQPVRNLYTMTGTLKQVESTSGVIQRYEVPTGPKLPIFLNGDLEGKNAVCPREISLCSSC